MKVALGSNEPLEVGPIILSDRWLIIPPQLLNEYGIHYNDSVANNLGL